ncbi:BTB and MATH domain-containing protein 41 [Tetrabaena socialis]|uniref:BTB and MATH domain-containing protein 41 n=1 Tax=Tetrabaena socialis TaxID=47790 RepID=A0A2J8A356_9CHLO|nr:BTB and MATH domain-containing protein 41 [Tetrabaena socialis]|eukprot:PNH06949.1 BTB and MATH domain-containing protein 41 [Tetrabaena socialis]
MACPHVVDLKLTYALRSVAVRPAPCSAASGGGAQRQGQAQQVLLFTAGGCFELLGLDGAGGGAGPAAAHDASGGVRVGSVVPLHGPNNAAWPCSGVMFVTYDANSSSLCAVAEDGLVRIDEAARVTKTNFPSGSLPFRLHDVEQLAADGVGSLYALGSEMLCLLVDSSGADVRGGGTVLLGRSRLDGRPVEHIAYDSGLRRLYVTSDKAIYNIRGTTATLLAGGPDGSSGRCRDGAGCNARFGKISAVIVGGDGCLYVADSLDGASSVFLRKVTPGGVVSTAQQFEWDADSSRECLNMALLPNGWLAVFDWMSTSLRLLQLGLQPSQLRPSKPEDLTSCSWRDDLAADLGALLLQQRHEPSATSDVTVRVGGTDFPAHRPILSARCPYFERHFATSVGETSRGPIVELPEADPAAVRYILSYIYTTDAGDWADVETAQHVAELADRLLLPKLRDEALRRLVAAVQVASVLPVLVWAERMGFSGAVQELLGFYADHQGAVLKQEEEALEQLMVMHPKLAIRLLRACQS